MSDQLDSKTIRAVAVLARLRAQGATMHLEGDRRDGLERLGVQKAMLQFAVDLEATADELDRDEVDDT